MITEIKQIIQELNKKIKAQKERHNIARLLLKQSRRDRK